MLTPSGATKSGVLRTIGRVSRIPAASNRIGTPPAIRVVAYVQSAALLGAQSASRQAGNAPGAIDAAVAAANHAVLLKLLPTQQAAIEGAYAQIGHKQGVSGKLDEIEQAGLLEDTTLAAFRDLVRRMQLAHLAQTLEKQTA